MAGRKRKNEGTSHTLHSKGPTLTLGSMQRTHTDVDVDVDMDVTVAVVGCYGMALRTAYDRYLLLLTAISDRIVVRTCVWEDTSKDGTVVMMRMAVDSMDGVDGDSRGKKGVGLGILIHSEMGIEGEMCEEVELLKCEG